MLTRILDLLTERGDAAFERQRPHGHTPPVAGFTDHEVGVGAGVIEKHLVELGVAGELDDRPDLDARLIQRHQQVGEAGVTLGPLLGPRHHEAPLRPVRQ